METFRLYFSNRQFVNRPYEIGRARRPTPTKMQKNVLVGADIICPPYDWLNTIYKPLVFRRNYYIFNDLLNFYIEII